MPIFGAYLDVGHERHGQYKKRIESIRVSSENALKSLIRRYPSLDGLVGVSMPNVFLACGRYFNELMVFDAEHQIERFHRAKIVSYEIRWFLKYPPLVSICSTDDLFALGDEEQEAIMDLPYLAMDIIIASVLKDDVLLYNEINDEKLKKKIEDTLDRLHYYVKTNAYNAKMASLYFDMLMMV
jgi:hypothetical protein